jgi:hypothetical protein
MGDWDWLNARSDAARAEEERLLAAAKAAAARSGKEPFDYEKLCTMYDPTSDLATEVRDPAQRARELEARYYVDHPAVMDLRTFAERLTEADTWR